MQIRRYAIILLVLNSSGIFARSVVRRLESPIQKKAPATTDKKERKELAKQAHKEFLAIKASRERAGITPEMAVQGIMHRNEQDQRKALRSHKELQRKQPKAIFSVEQIKQQQHMINTHASLTEKEKHKLFAGHEQINKLADKRNRLEAKGANKSLLDRLKLKLYGARLNSAQKAYSKQYHQLSRTYHGLSTTPLQHPAPAVQSSPHRPIRSS